MLQQTMEQICNFYVLKNLMTTQTQHMHVTIKHSKKIPVRKLNALGLG